MTAACSGARMVPPPLSVRKRAGRWSVSSSSLVPWHLLLEFFAERTRQSAASSSAIFDSLLEAYASAGHRWKSLKPAHGAKPSPGDRPRSRRLRSGRRQDDTRSTEGATREQRRPSARGDLEGTRKATSTCRPRQHIQVIGRTPSCCGLRRVTRPSLPRPATKRQAAPTADEAAAVKAAFSSAGVERRHRPRSRPRRLAHQRQPLEVHRPPQSWFDEAQISRITASRRRWYR